MRSIYLDHNATTPLHPRVLEAMLPYLRDQYGNASSIHGLGRHARAALDDARDRLANLLGAKASEIIFTSSGTEADNLALFGIARAQKNRGKHIVTTAIEHHAVLHAAKHLQKQEGFEVTFMPVDTDCLISPDEIDRILSARPDTILVSVMTANNETGTIQPIAQIGEICRRHGVLFHSDAVQAFGKIPICVSDLKADLLSISAHKFYGPKGVGALIVRGGVKLEPLLIGGSHEMDRRAGTENVAGIVGMVAAAELAIQDFDHEPERLRTLTEKLWRGIAQTVEGARRNGHAAHRVPNTLNVSFAGLQGVAFDGEELLMNLDLAGIAASSGSACAVGSMQPSHVLRAMGLSNELVRSAVRFSAGAHTTEADMDYVLDVLPKIAERLHTTKIVAYAIRGAYDTKDGRVAPQSL